MSVDRRAFLRGKLSGVPAIRPPGSVAEEDFRSLCSGCGDCVPLCPTGVLTLQDAMASIDFARGECTRCGKCAEACPTGAIDIANRADSHLVASIGASCLTLQGIECRLCGDPCMKRAITFLPARGGIRLPQVDSSSCNGCGACYAPCPARAIQFNAIEEACPA